MGKMLLVSGANGSGKSRFAEGLIARTDGPRLYIATLQPVNEENRARIQKHRLQRAGLRFSTLELPDHVGDAPVPAGGVVLLEDLSNLLANILFGRSGRPEEALDQIRQLRAKSRLLVVVTISGLAEEGYEGETAGYIRALNRLNADLLAEADAAAELRSQTPFWQKGSPDALF